MKNVLLNFNKLTGHAPPPPFQLGGKGGELKISEKSLQGGGGGQKFLFWWGGSYCLGGGSHNFEVKTKTA